MGKQPLHEIMARMLAGDKLTEADNVVGKTDTTIKVDKDVKDPNQQAIDTANIIKSAPTREDPNKDTSNIDEDDVDGIADGILVVTDPEITSEEFEEVADELQGIVDKSEEGELPFTDRYKGDYILSCPICGGTFVNDTLLDSGEDVCPICCKVPDAFVVSGRIEDAESTVKKEEVQDDIEHEENLDEPTEDDETRTPDIPLPTSDEIEDEEEEKGKKESKSISGNKLQESKDDEEEQEDEPEFETEEDAVDFLVDDEKEAIEGYEEVLDNLDEMGVEDKELYQDKLDEIIEDEKQHIEILKGLENGEDISDEDLEKEDLTESKEVEGRYLVWFIKSKLYILETVSKVRTDKEAQKFFDKYVEVNNIDLSKFPEEAIKNTLGTIKNGMDFATLEVSDDNRAIFYHTSNGGGTMYKNDVIWVSEDRVNLKEGNDMEEINAGNIKRKAQEILPAEDIDTHGSDLYLKVSNKSTELINKMKDKDSGLLNKFRSHVDNEMWYELPFCNMEDDYKSKKEEAGVSLDIDIPDDTVNSLANGVGQALPALLLASDKKDGKVVTEEYDEDDTRNKAPINPDDKEYYNGKLWQVRVWSGSGYTLNYFNVYGDGDNIEDMLCKVVAYAEKNEDEILLPLDAVLNDINDFYADEWAEYKAENPEADEYDFATNYLDYVYIDATVEGASQPYFIRGENLAVLDHNMNEGKLEEDLSKDLLAKVEGLGKKAFENGMKRVPAQDKELVGILEGIPVGEGGKILDAWLNGWDNANIEAPVNESKVVEDKSNTSVLDSINVDTFEDLKSALDELYDNEKITDDEFDTITDIIDEQENSCVRYLRDRAEVTNTDWKDELAIEADYVSATIQKAKEALIKTESKVVEDKEKVVEEKLVWTDSEDYGSDEGGFEEWLDYQEIDLQAEAISYLEDKGIDEPDEEDIEMAIQEIRRDYEEQYYEMLNEQLMEDWEDRIKPMIENQLGSDDIIICMGTAETWDKKGSAYRMLGGVSELQDLMAGYDKIDLFEDENGNLTMYFGHHDGTHVMGLYTFNGDYEMLFERLKDKGIAIFNEYEDFDEFLFDNYETDTVEYMLDNISDCEDIVKEELTPIKNQ